MSELAPFEAYVDALLARLQPAERRALARKIATSLRRSQDDRVAAQQNPDGSAFEPRKSRAPLRTRTGAVRRKVGAMFAKLRAAKHLSARATEQTAEAGFHNATVARVARVHQLGLRDRVRRFPGAAEVVYPQRVLLGFTEADRSATLDLLLEHVGRD